MGEKRISLDMREIHRARKDGHTYKEIASWYMCSPVTVSRRYREWKENKSKLFFVWLKVKNFLGI